MTEEKYPVTKQELIDGKIPIFWSKILKTIKCFTPSKTKLKVTKIIATMNFS